MVVVICTKAFEVYRVLKIMLIPPSEVESLKNNERKVNSLPAVPVQLEVFVITSTLLTNIPALDDNETNKSIFATCESTYESSFVNDESQSLFVVIEIYFADVNCS